MTIRFSNAGPAFPGAFVDSLLAGEMVFLCGTGISSPQLPDFQCLVECTYAKLGVERDAPEERAFKGGRYEEVLGSLSRRLVDSDAVTRTVSELLTVRKDPCIDQHRTILHLSRDLENRIAVVTTNFDTLLERAATELPGHATPSDFSFAGQALPPPSSSSFSGIMHIHGRLADRELGLGRSPLVLTSADYGDAYMRSGWASRFLFDLARCKTIVLVGYSANDAPARYFLNVLAADRARFPDLKPVYALNGYERDPCEATLSWRTLAVTPLPYSKVNPGTGNHDHAPLWRDLAALGNVVARPQRSRRDRARAILEGPVADASPGSRRELGWLFGGRRDLWSVALDAIGDADWFKVFHDQGLWSADDCVWVVAAWVAKDLQSAERFECAREWQERLGRPLTEKIAERLLHAKGLDETWTRVWRLFCLGEPVRHNEVCYYETRKRLASSVVLDSDVRRAVSLLTPQLVLSRSHRELRKEGSSEPVRRLGDLAWARLVISDRHSAEGLVDALRELPGQEGRILELATSELRSALALEAELALIGVEHDLNDSRVPSIESNAQNRFHGGVNFLIRVVVQCLPRAAALNGGHTRRLVSGWKCLPGRIGLRLCLHAMRDTALFDADEAMSILLSVSDVNFWSIRRELALLLKDRAGTASAEVLSRVEQRILESGEAYYERFPVEQGEADWRGHARDAAVWLRLKMLQDAGALSEIGAMELSAITERRNYLDREVEERDFFGAYTSGVRRIVGDPARIVEAPADDRLRLAHELADSPDLGIQQGWSAFCRSDPQGAFDALSGGDLTPANGVLWHEYLSGLAVGGEESIAVQAMEHLSGIEAETLRPMVSGLCALLYSTPRERIPNVDGWLVKLWEAIVQQPEEPIDRACDLYDRAFNSSSGKLAQTLLWEIDARRSADENPTNAQQRLLRSIAGYRGVAGQLGRAVLVRHVAFLVTVDRHCVDEMLAPYINDESDEGRALRAVMLIHGAVTPEVSQAFRNAIVTGVVESASTDDHAATVASNVLSPVLGDLRGDDTVQWGLTAAEVASALRQAKPAIRCGALEVLAGWLRTDDLGAEEAWRTVGAPFFRGVWPKERECNDVVFTPYFIDLVVNAGDECPRALEVLRPYVCPYDQGYGSLHSITKSELPEKFPRETLDLVWLVCGPKSCGKFYEVSDVIDRLIKSDPDIESDRRLQWLKQRVERYD